ncbi:GNAT family N-acetyltransferase [Microbacterium sp. G2-8]|uniref:GNAT family N-acetyltransferase n=1 Tax=Microbacterium sp. G2-8 TaxID=2842454 RepID=UPI001C8AE869|nr:GNAT family N-acetyltransferase [Microbacterium sp. G2-8]
MSTDSTAHLRVVRAEARYEIWDDELGAEPTMAGFAQFETSGDAIKIVHTEIDNAFRGRGYAQVLAERSLADIIARDEVLWPLCPFYAKHLTTHLVEGLRVHWPFGQPVGAATPNTD